MQRAILLTSGLFHTEHAKTAHGLVRESNRYQIVGVCDNQHAGKDAGALLDGKHRGIPIFATVAEAMQTKPEVCIVGVATAGGVFPNAMLTEVMEAISLKLNIVNGLHDHLNDRPEIKKLAEGNGVQVTDLRATKKLKDLHFWAGKIFQVKSPIVAVIGTDCVLGKRTTTRLVMNACTAAGMNAQMIYTGQTGWLQGDKYGLILDSIINDFVSGEIEHAVVTCYQETNPDVIFIEGQSALRNPSGPCGAEFLISGGAKAVILVHAPSRKYYEHDPAWGEIHSVGSEIRLIEQLGSRVIAIALNTEQLSHSEALQFQSEYEKLHKVPVLLPLEEGCEKIVPVIAGLISSRPM